MSKSALKILETAEALFNEHSIVGVGVDLIRDTSGCSKTTMYTYYKNKQQLINAVLYARDTRFKQSLNAAIEGLEAKAAIDALFAWHVAWSQQDHFKGCLFVRAVAEARSDDQEIINIAQQHKQWIKQLIEMLCRQAGKAQYSELIYTLFEGYIARCLVEGFHADTAERIQQNIDVLLTE